MLPVGRGSVRAEDDAPTPARTEPRPTGASPHQEAFSFGAPCTIADQQVAADGDHSQQSPGRNGIRFHQAACVYPWTSRYGLTGGGVG
jgi:hypothetical protein